MPLNNGESFAGFRIVRLLGSGGMGEGLPDPGGSGEHRHDRGWSIARMIDSRAAATRVVDMIAKMDRWVSAPWCRITLADWGDMANRNYQYCKFAALSLAKDLTDPFTEGGQIGTRSE